jgi:uncharacterized protein (DUF885 family)
MSNGSAGRMESLDTAAGIVDDAWDELRTTNFVQEQTGAVPKELPDLSFAEAQRRSAVGRSLLERLERLDWSCIPHDLTLTLRLVRFRALTWSREAEWYWHVADPRGIGFFGMFTPTCYAGGWLLNTIHSQLGSIPLADSAGTDNYLALVADYARLVHQFADRTLGQELRGIRMPKVQVVQARALLTAFKCRVRAALDVSAQRLPVDVSDGFRKELLHRVESLVEPAFDRALSDLGDSYLSLAPDTVGLAQYPKGAEIYAELVKLHTTSELNPQQVHAAGCARMEEIGTLMRGVRQEMGFEGTATDFLARLNADHRWRADTAVGIAAFFQRYIDRLKRRYHEYFRAEPLAAYGVAPLPEALQGSMTFGYYNAPKRGQAQGLYLFNSLNLSRQGLFNIGSLTYHELMPGHHLHLASQQENTSLHPFRLYSLVNAFNEGWAEYAATLAGEMGLYEEPEERYGRLVMDSFLTCRLVVDTGMNALGWSLERAREYMRAHSGMSEAEILTETVRYSCDIPAQALAYKLGDQHFLALRNRMQNALGARFDIRDFHESVLAAGALPMPDLDWHLDQVIAERAKNSALSSHG